MIRVEVKLEDSFEIHNVPASGLHWSDANILALQIVFEDLKRRAIDEGLSLDGLEMAASVPRTDDEAS